MKITYAELFDAIEKNGYPKVRKSYGPHRVDGRSALYGYCSFGQAAKNLGFYDTAAVGSSIRDTDVFSFITDLNDFTNLTLPEIAASAREKYARQLNDEFEVSDVFLKG